ncbi:hypothetical protein M422DRAFT_31921 [Sphaerobolus stellatus SS14]|uniref:Uncharacterized protein n=1 Tax=Sphaerobolus stellatus (strain SS14) TaxID=990650 RepID=A0A0C9VSI7_SPHS4|nr:hypothetical protein M422DRAFT_31921 [Sphaerobolus stellatus SS14]
MCLVLATNNAVHRMPMPPPKSWVNLKEILEPRGSPGGITHWTVDVRYARFLYHVSSLLQI